MDSTAVEDEAAHSIAAHTSTNPKIDSFHMATVAPRGQPAGVGFSDLAITDYHYYLARTDGVVERHLRNSTADFDSYISGTFQHLNYVRGGSWRVIGSNDATRKIYYKIDNVRSELASYPSGVNYLIELAGRAGPNNTLDLFVVYNSSPNGYLPVLKKGTYDPRSGMTWSSGTQTWGQYSHGLCIGDGKLRTMVNYMTGYFAWYDHQTLAKGTETIAPYTEHAYEHPGGFLDRLAPVGFDTTDAGYWGIDVAVDPSGGRTWEIGYIPYRNLR